MTCRDLLRACVDSAHTGRRPALPACTADDITISGDVFLAELETILAAPHPDIALTALFSSGIGAAFMPEVAALDLDQGGRRLHKDNLAHTFTVVAQAVNRRRVRWAALCHDLGKPPTRVIATNGTVTFHNHETVGAKITTKMLTRLGVDRSFTADVARLVEISGRIHDFSADVWTDAAVRRFATDAGELVADAFDVARADCTSARPGRRAQVIAQVDAVAARLAEIAASDARKAIRPALDGDEIMAALGVGPGPRVGQAYKHLLGFAHDGIVLSRDEAYDELARWAASQPD